MAKKNNSKPKTDSRERILDVAETLFAHQGYHGTTTRQIAEQAGITLPTLHYHCGGKLKLHTTILERAIQPIFEMLARYADEISGQDINKDKILYKFIDRIIEELFDRLSEHPNHPLLFFRLWVEKDGEAYRLPREEWTPFVRQWAIDIEKHFNAKRKKDLNLPLTLLTLSVSLWGLFINPDIPGMLGVKPDSPEHLAALKRHAKTMSARMMGLKPPETGAK
jgi:AcrR family transcriptional regulator